MKISGLTAAPALLAFVAIIASMVTPNNAQDISQAELVKAKELMYLSDQAYLFLWTPFIGDRCDADGQRDYPITISSGCIKEKYGYSYFRDVLNENAYAQIWLKDDTCYVAFRGAIDLVDYLKGSTGSLVTTNSGLQVDKTIFDHYMLVKAGIVDAIADSGCTEVMSTGHSLGADAALVMHADGLSTSSVTFSGTASVKRSSCNDAFRAKSDRFYLTLWGLTDYVPPVGFGSDFAHCAGRNMEIKKYVSWGRIRHRLEFVSESEPRLGISIEAHLSWSVLGALDGLDGSDSLNGMGQQQAYFTVEAEGDSEGDSLLDESGVNGLALGSLATLAVCAALFVGYRRFSTASSTSSSTRSDFQSGSTTAANPMFVRSKAETVIVAPEV